MSQHFPGLLKNPTEPDSGLRVTLVLEADVVQIESNDISLGQWKRTEIDAARSEGNWFQLEIDDEDWRFLPDTPTEFLFYAVPHFADNGARPRRWKPAFRIAATDLVYLGRIAVGAVLAVLLLSIGMFMGRYRWDNSSVAVLAVLVAAAASGAWWTFIQAKETFDKGAPTRGRAPVLRPDGKRSALSVRDAIATAHLDRSDTVAGRPDTEPGKKPTAPERETLQSATSSADAFEAVAEQDTDHTGSDGEIEVAEPEGVDSIVEEPEVPEFHRASAWEETDERHDDQVDPASAGDQSSDVVEVSEAPTSDEFGMPEPASVEAPNPEEPAPSLDLSISVAELIDKTADVAEPAKLVEKPADRAKEASPIDLTVIRGIGPALSAALTQLGVTDVRDLAILDTDDLAYLERRLGRFASRNRARQWVAQAQRIVAEQDTDHTGSDGEIDG